MPSEPRKVGNQLVVPVMPDSFKEKQLWNGYRGEVWLNPGVDKLVQVRSA